MVQSVYFKPTLVASFIASTLALPVTAYGQSETVELAPVEVWGTQIRTSSVKIKDENLDIKQADHISDLLRTIPGVDVGGAHSLNQRITIRSMDDKDLRIFIDGANQNTYMYHHMGNLQINSDILESVDVEVGNNSVINGGLGGVVRFDTKTADQLLEPGQRFGGRVEGNYGDNYGGGISLTGYGKISDSVDVLAYYNKVDRDNYEVGGGEIKDFSGNVVPNTDGMVRGLEGELDDALLKFGFDIADNQRLEVGYETYRDKGDYSYRPDMGLATDLAIANSLNTPLTWPTEFTRDTLTLNYDLDFGQYSSLTASLFQNVSELERDELGWASNPAFASSAGIIDGKATNSGLNLLADSEIGIHTLTYGGEYIKYDTDYNASYTNSTVDSSQEEAINTALYIQDRIQIGDKFALTPGIRHNIADIDSMVVDDSFSETTGALAAEYEITPSLTLGASSTQLFKGPEIGEVFTGAGLYDTPNPGIEAETGSNTEISLAYENSIAGNDRFITGITLFQTDLDNYIYDYATPPPSVGGGSWADNIGDMQIKGYEAYIGYNTGNLRTLLTYSTADSELDAFDEYSYLDGSRLDRIQGDTVSIDVDYDIPARGLTLHWDAIIVGSVGEGPDLDGATANNAKDGYVVNNISVRWTSRNTKGLAFIFGVDNLFDEYYASQSSRTGLSLHPRFGELYLLDYEPGRNVKATLSYTF